MSDDATRSRAATPTPHCTKFGCGFFTAYGEPTERCIRCGSTPHATPDRVASEFDKLACLVEQWNDTAAQLEGNRNAGLRGIAAGRRECAEHLTFVLREMGVDV